MLLFVISQNPLYLALENNNKIRPLDIIGNRILELGYADDTNIITGDDESFMEIFNVFHYFERATNSKINIRKTKVYGFGNWEKRRMWPIVNLKVEEEYFTTLGIHFSCNYDIALKTMWKYIYDKIQNRIPMIRNRNFTLYQKATLINSLIASKIWYVSHVYPLPIKYSTLINKEIFTFLWGSNSNPIKRIVIYNKKGNGGLGLLNIFQKAKSIFVGTMIRSFLLSDVNDLIRYYIANKVGNIFNIINDQRNITSSNAPYYEYAIDTIKICKTHKNFPHIKSKDIYEIISPQCTPDIVNKYNFDWNNIWTNLNFKYINIVDRNIMFKYIYEILPTNHRLANIRLRQSPMCDYCNQEDTNSHKFYHCVKVQECVSWLRKVIFYIGGVQTDSLLKILYLDIPKINRKNMNLICIIIACYISCVWSNRENLTYIKNIMKAKLLRTHRFHIQLLGEAINKIFSENYCNMDIRILNKF